MYSKRQLCDKRDNCITGEIDDRRDSCMTGEIVVKEEGVVRQELHLDDRKDSYMADETVVRQKRQLYYGRDSCTAREAGI